MVGKLKREVREKMILEKLDRPKTLHELKYEVLLSKSTIECILKGLVEKGLVVKDGFKYCRVKK